MPNIFERARAYDNWNEGNFQPQKMVMALSVTSTTITKKSTIN